MLTTLVKQPAEQLRHQPAFTTLSPIATVLSIAVAPRGLVPGASALTAVEVTGAGAAAVWLAGGGDGERYLVTVRVQDAAGETLESEVEVAVIEAAWALPDGGAPWLSIVDFVKRVGLDEVTRMTDASGAGRVDRDLLTAALADAQTIAEPFLAGRYALPLAAVPPLVALVVADLARERLYPNTAPDGVARAATAARKTLERVQDGSLPLPIAGAAGPAEAPGDAPIVISPGRRAYPDALADY